MRKGITSHTIVKDEDLYVWYAIKSVINYVDRMIIYDTGSSDKTLQTIKSIKSAKIVLEEKGEKDANQLIELRRQQLERTKTDWFLILDGDEIWWEESIKKVRDLAMGEQSQMWGIITPTINCVGDIYHYQEKKAGKYKFANLKGHLAVRAIRSSIPGLHVEGTYPLEGYKDSSGRPVTENSDRLYFLNQPYLHLTNLKRSSQDSKRVISREKKYEIGIPFPENFKYPEVFYLDAPDWVPSPWHKMSSKERIWAMIQTPLKKIKRRL